MSATTTVDVGAEIRALARFQGLDEERIEAALSLLAPHLERYAELVLTERGLEVIAGGCGRKAARELGLAALWLGASRAATVAFLAADARFPARPLGLKVCFGPDAAAPSLYVRTMCAKDEGLDFLSTQGIAVDALREALASNTRLYGLGFFGRGPALDVKTYALGEVAGETGFISHRIVLGRVSTEPKLYARDVPWSAIDIPGARWRALLDFARDRLGALIAGHVGWEDEDGARRFKVYVERVGAIPTDVGAR